MDGKILGPHYCVLQVSILLSSTCRMGWAVQATTVQQSMWQPDFMRAAQSLRAGVKGCGQLIQMMCQTSNQLGCLEQMQPLALSCLAPRLCFTADTQGLLYHSPCSPQHAERTCTAYSGVSQHTLRCMYHGGALTWRHQPEPTMDQSSINQSINQSRISSFVRCEPTSRLTV